jgi:hypothetical protein
VEAGRGQGKERQRLACLASFASGQLASYREKRERMGEAAPPAARPHARTARGACPTGPANNSSSEGPVTDARPLTFSHA